MKFKNIILKNKNLFYEGIYKFQKKEIEKIYRNNFKEDYFNRSYCQYLCQKKMGITTKDSFNVFWIFGYLSFILFYFILKKNKIKKEKVEILFFGGHNSIIPDKYKRLKSVEMKDKYCLKKEDVKFWYNEVLKKSKKYNDSFFCFKILIKIGMYRFNIEKYNPEIIRVTNEYSYTSSILTKYCENNGIKHINIMHGDKLYNIRDSFFKFHECFVWEEYYKKLFIELKADRNQFRIEDKDIKYLNILSSNVTYYLQGNEEKFEIEKIIKFLLKFSKIKNLSPKIRLHPRHSNESIKKIIPKEMIDIEKIEVSINSSEYIVSKYSSVLYEGYLLNKKLIIDDYTKGKEFYNILKELKYIMRNKKHLRLSEIKID